MASQYVRCPYCTMAMRRSDLIAMKNPPKRLDVRPFAAVLKSEYQIYQRVTPHASQTKFAKMIEMSIYAFQHIVKNQQKSVNVDNAFHWCEKLGVDPAEIWPDLFRSGEEPGPEETEERNQPDPAPSVPARC